MIGGKQDRMAELSRRIDRIDEHGTRGIAPLAVQLTEVVKDVAELKTEMRGWFRDHEEMHRVEERSRLSTRRWTIGIIIAAVAAVDGPLVTILLARH